jgi:exopolysaccharide biosynthesis polyprenyl glycosylphosphotransferase
LSKKKEKIFVLTTDFITVNLAWIAFFYVRVHSGWFALISEPEFILPMIAVYFYWLFIFTFVGMYRTWFALSRLDELSSLFKAVFVGIFLLFVLILYDDYQVGVTTSVRFFIIIYWGIIFLFVGFGRVIIRSIQKRILINGFGRRNALIVGFNTKANEIHESILKNRALGLDIVAYVGTHESDLYKSFHNIPVVSTIQNLENIIDQYLIKDIIISLGWNEEDTILEVIARSDEKNVEIKIVPDLYNIISGQAKVTQLHTYPLIDIMPGLMPEWEKKLKRLMDIILSLGLIIFSLPVTLISALIIKLESKGPVFYKQERMGLNGKLFKIYKFRSMVSDAEIKTGPVWSTKDDPRITRFGRFIRKVRIDEIPQTFNILKGDMSFVGPRPERPFFVEKLSHEIPLYKRRLKVRPGVTGWAQVKHKYDENIEDVKLKTRYDLFYIENMSLRMDFKIIFRTVFVVLFGKGHFD